MPTETAAATGNVPKNAPHPELAKLFLDFLLSEQGQRILAERTGLYAIHPDLNGRGSAAQLQSAAGINLRPIQVGPGLLVYLDQLKRRKFLSRWNRMLQGY